MKNLSTRQVVELKKCFADPLLEVMNFLNEIALEYPQAISFGPGRPPAAHFSVENAWNGVRDYVRANSDSRLDEERIWQDLGQYGRTNGIISEVIARHLAADEGIHVPAESIMTTVGAQEAMAVILMGLFDSNQDILLVSDPSYIGITGLARLLGIRTISVPTGENGLEPQTFREVVDKCLDLGQPRALYDIPDFNNPMGTTLALDRRYELLTICRQYGLLLIEDNPYGMFIYDGERVPTIKSLDTSADKTVLYIGSFAKSVFPGLRLGYLVADQIAAHSGAILAEELSKVKSLLTVNTSPLLQAVVAGILFANGNSLREVVRPKVDELRRKRDLMLECLALEFSDMLELIHWNRPNGGFFLTLTLPFQFGKEELKRCAEEYGVVVTPMRFFTLGEGHDHQVRLSFSSVSEDEICAGLKRLSSFVRERSNRPSR